MKHCPFCFETNDGRARTMLENNQAIGLLSSPRLAKGHCLVIPKRHVENPSDLTEPELIDIFQLIDVTRQRLLSSGLAKGVDVRQHFRPFLPQSRVKVDHVHFHVLPRKPNDLIHQESLVHEHKLFADLSDKERGQVEKLFNT